MSDENKKCKVVDIPGLLPGIACCQCSSYNGQQRTECKYCGHSFCCQLETKTIPIKQEDGTVSIHTVKVPQPDKGNLN